MRKRFRKLHAAEFRGFTEQAKLLLRLAKGGSDARHSDLAVLQLFGQLVQRIHFLLQVIARYCAVTVPIMYNLLILFLLHTTPRTIVSP